MMSATTRFAPSPTGLLHLGHAHAALFAVREAGAEGSFLLRIEDIDASRCREPFVQAIFDDLSWLGLSWPEPVRRQSAHMEDYRAALARLDGMGLLYPCFCTRADIARAGDAPQGPDGPIYPGICHSLSVGQRAERIAQGVPFALRLDMARALAETGPLSWRDLDRGEIEARPDDFGDVVLARKDTPTSYHLAVSVDDALQGIDIVTRGMDLFPSTHVHRLLQALLGLPVPVWRHHPLILDETGRRLAKRDNAPSLRGLREQGLSPGQVRRMAGFA